MIGFDTNIIEELTPFHKDITPSSLITLEPVWTIDLFKKVCFVWRTQNGQVKILDIVPASVEDIAIWSIERFYNLRIAFIF